VVRLYIEAIERGGKKELEKKGFSLLCRFEKKKRKKRGFRAKGNIDSIQSFQGYRE